MTWETVSGALENVWSMVNSCVTFITSNTALLFLFVSSLVPVGFKLFKKAKRSVK